MAARVFQDHDIDATTTSGSLPWSLRCHCLPKEYFPPWTEHHLSRSCPNTQQKKKHRRPSKRDANTPMATHHRKAILHVRLSWNRLDFQAKMDNWDRPTRTVDSNAKKKRKVGPTDRQSGSVHVTMTPPRHADKDCSTTEENVTISTSRITRQGHCRCGAAGSSLVARNHQPTNGRRPQWTTGDTRTVAWWNLRATVTDDENERRTAQRRTCKGVRRSRTHLAWKKKGVSERAKYVRELPVSGTGARRRGPQISADPVQA